MIFPETKTPAVLFQDLIMWWFLLFLEWLVDWGRGTFWYLFGRRSGLCKGTISPPGPLVVEQKKKDRVLRKGM